MFRLKEEQSTRHLSYLSCSVKEEKHVDESPWISKNRCHDFTFYSRLTNLSTANNNK